MRGIRGIRVGMMEMRAIRVGIHGIRVGMRGIRVGKRGTGGGNEGNKGENLCIEVELMNYSCGEGQETRNCVFLVIV